MSTPLKEETKKVADFTRDTVFPLIDAFTATHRLTISAESGVLVLLAQRLVYQGFKPEQIVDLVTKAAAMTQESPAPAPAPVPATVLKFPR